MREPLIAFSRQAVCVVFRGFAPKLATSVLTTLVFSALFAQLAPERPVAMTPAVTPAPAAVPLERLWPREADLTRVFSFTLDTAGQPFSAVASMPPAAPIGAPEAPAPAAPVKVTSAKPRTAPRIAAASMLPPPRPTMIEPGPSIAVAAESAAAPELKPVRLLGMTLPGWVPSSESVANTVTALGGAVRDRLSF